MYVNTVYSLFIKFIYELSMLLVYDTFSLCEILVIFFFFLNFKYQISTFTYIVKSIQEGASLLCIFQNIEMTSIQSGGNDIEIFLY